MSKDRDEQLMPHASSLMPKLDHIGIAVKSLDAAKIYEALGLTINHVEVVETQKGHKYFDPKSTADNPIWFMVDIAFVEKFPRIVPLDTLKETRGLEEMMVIRKGSRLSIQPVTRAEFDIVVKLGRKGAKS